MYKLYAMWGPPQDPDAFEDYYAATHVPLAAAVPGLRELNLVLTADGLGDAPSLTKLMKPSVSIQVSVPSLVDAGKPA